MRFIIIFILILSQACFAITIADEDFKKMQTMTTQYVAGYNRTINLYNELITTYSNDGRYYRQMITLATNENRVLQKEIKRKNVELIVEKAEKIVILGVVVAALVKIFGDMLKSK
jgi:hypothetical protein